VLRRPLRDEHRVVEIGIERNGTEHAHDTEVGVVQPDGARLAAQVGVLLREPGTEYD
jgi:hypothetical protein